MTKKTATRADSIAKTPTGINGLDEITFGGLPTGRPTLICGAAGAGKTMLAAEFIIRGATQFGEPGVFVMFEENAEELTENVRSLGFDLDKLQAQGKISLDHVHIQRSEIEETGEYDLEGLFIRLSYAIESIGAKRIVLDTLEALFAGLPNHAVLRAELRRLFRWLKDKGMTAVITGERGENSLTRYGLEEYVADCVILLDHRVNDQISTRRLRIVKYRGSAHGTNEYPFLIGTHGISVMPITSLGLDHDAPTERVSSGVPSLDEMLAGKGVFRGSSVLISGSPGTGKSSLAVHFAAAACKRREKAILFAYEESASQIVRNMKSIGVDLEPFIKKGLVTIHSTRPTLQGLEQHLVMMHDEIERIQPKVVVIDPISNLSADGAETLIKPTLMRLIDLMKRRRITAVFTSLTSAESTMSETSEVGVSSLMDTWLLLRNTEANGERNRTIFVLKSRGMNHSNQVREFVMSDDGIKLVEPYIGPESVLTGTARIMQEERAGIATELRVLKQNRLIREMEDKRASIDAQVAALNAKAATIEADLQFIQAEYQADEAHSHRSSQRLAKARGRKESTPTSKRGK